MSFPRPLAGSGDLNFSFSGLKTSVLYWLKKRPPAPLSPDLVSAVGRGFQDAVRDVLLKKTEEAVRKVRARCLLLAGGVARNESLRTGAGELAETHGIPLLCAPLRYCTDNGVMVAALAWRKYADGARDDFTMDIAPGLKLC